MATDNHIDAHLELMDSLPQAVVDLYRVLARNAEGILTLDAAAVAIMRLCDAHDRLCDVRAQNCAQIRWRDRQIEAAECVLARNRLMDEYEAELDPPADDRDYGDDRATVAAMNRDLNR